eukprot:TRINITY_DN9452_c0_g1_i3.p1 TRINITY_DN9452_c0_g1~~TRINITY_DN9452_c0_g1_i3.p1  ORF type:complete len:296 (+),score=28.47 TRINITY_DN9452_c0_g1_i3:78-890(+)
MAAEDAKVGAGSAELPEPAFDDFFDDRAPIATLAGAERVGSPPAESESDGCHRVRIVNRTGCALKIVRVGYGSASSPGMANRSSLVHAAQNVVHSDEGLAVQMEGGVIADGELWEQPITPLARNPTFSTWFALAQIDAGVSPSTKPTAAPPSDAGTPASEETASLADSEEAGNITVPTVVLALSNPMIGAKKIDVGEGCMERWCSRDMPDSGQPKAYREMVDGTTKQKGIWGGAITARAELHQLSGGACRWCFWLLSSDSVHRCASFSVD